MAIFKVSPVEGIRRLFYLITPNESSFETKEEVPQYVNDALPFFFSLIVLEALVQWVRGKRTLRVNDAISSMSAGLYFVTAKFLIAGVELVLYLYIYENYRLIELPWNSPWTWLACFLGVDFSYYWLHRCGHEVNFWWAGHQVHHSSEDYNLSTALRQSAPHQYTSFVFYLPLALAIPPSIYLVHTEFSLLYQFWIHTEVIGTLGPLEYIINTPSSHRVHHGVNRYCIDRNYAGTLIIWDRMFGTYVPEEEEVVYGVTHPLNSFDPNYVQFCHFVHMWKTFWEVPGFANKLKSIVNGPGWAPGKPRTGLIEDIPDVHAPMKKYDPESPLWLKIYAVMHFFTVLAVYQVALEIRQELSNIVVLAVVGHILFTLTCLGALFDHKWYGPYVECVRSLYCVLLYTFLIPRYMSVHHLPSMIQTFLCMFFLFSLLIWAGQILCTYFTTGAPAMPKTMSKTCNTMNGFKEFSK